MEIEIKDTSNKHKEACFIEIHMKINHEGIQTRADIKACPNTMMVAIANLEMLKLKILKDLEKTKLE